MSRLTAHAMKHLLLSIDEARGRQHQTERLDSDNSSMVSTKRVHARSSMPIVCHVFWALRLFVYS